MNNTKRDLAPERVDFTQTIHRSASGDITFSYQGWRMDSTDLTWSGCGHTHPTPFEARECASGELETYRDKMRAAQRRWDAFYGNPSNGYC